MLTINTETIRIKDENYPEFNQAYLEEALEFVEKMSETKSFEEVKNSVNTFIHYMTSRASSYGSQLTSVQIVELEDEQEIAMNVKVIMSVIAYDLKEALHEISERNNIKLKVFLEEDGKELLLKIKDSRMFEEGSREIMSITLPESFKSFTNRGLLVSLYSVVFRAVLIVTKNPFTS